MKDKLLEHFLEIGFLIIGICIVILAVLIFYNKMENDGYKIKLYGLVISSAILGLTVFHSEMKSSLGTKEIKENTEKNLKLSTEIKANTDETKEISQLIDSNVILLKIQNSKIEEYNKAIDKNLLGVKEINVLQSKEIQKQKFPFPEKLYFSMALCFKFSKDLDYNQLFKTYLNDPGFMNFGMMIPTKEAEDAFSMTTKNLGILQLSAKAKKNTDKLVEFDGIKSIKFQHSKNIDLNDLTDAFIPKNDNSIFGMLDYETSTKNYYLKIHKFPLTIYKNPNISTVYDFE